MASVTSSPSTVTRSPTSTVISRAISAGGRRRSREASVTARYIAPVSRYVKPSWAATALATLDLPAPAGPSIAMTIGRMRLLRDEPRDVFRHVDAGRQPLVRLRCERAGLERDDARPHVERV